MLTQSISDLGATIPSIAIQAFGCYGLVGNSGGCARYDAQKNVNTFPKT